MAASIAAAAGAVDAEPHGFTQTLTSPNQPTHENSNRIPINNAIKPQPVQYFLSTSQYCICFISFEGQGQWEIVKNQSMSLRIV